MVNYRRIYLKGGTYFITLTLRNRKSDLLVRRIDILRDAVRDARRRRPFDLPAVVVMPEHMHLLIRLPMEDDDHSARIRDIKSGFVKGLRATGEAIRLNRRGEADVWQARYWEHCIRDEPDYAAHVDYIHYNPVKHGLVALAKDWPWSSFRRYVERGDLPLDWAGGVEALRVGGDD
ncbi:transposase [Pseudomonas sp. PIC25]|uniref:REP-associated tyrosine transposase n=1 Tax=Pseudomonas sp. PIC25 TaxID=1958773 RepID=UPI000BAB2BED|nr:transposase [Pseudomonas sp. PIC25]PAU52327.1 transposase [Pseudomonas sp. PIC25]